MSSQKPEDENPFLNFDSDANLDASTGDFSKTSTSSLNTDSEGKGEGDASIHNEDVSPDWHREVELFQQLLHKADFAKKERFQNYLSPITKRLLAMMASRYGASQTDLLEVLIWTMFERQFSRPAANLSTLVSAMDELKLQISRYTHEVELMEELALEIIDRQQELISSEYDTDQQLEEDPYVFPDDAI